MNGRRGHTWLLSAALAGVLSGCAGQTSPPWSHQHLAAGRTGATAEAATSEKRVSQGQSSLTADEYEHLADRSVAGKNLTVAMAQYQKALQLDPGRARVREKRGFLFLERGLAEDAIVEFKTMADHGPIPAAASIGEGRALAYLGRWEEAENAFRRALAGSPQEWRAYAWLGIVAYVQERYPDALAAFQTACSLKPEHPGLANNLGQAYVALGRYDDAIASFRLAGAHAPDHPRLTLNLIGALTLARQHDAAEQVRRHRSHDASANAQDSRKARTGE
jgi:Flp pilus assembly protein TadD